MMSHRLSLLLLHALTATALVCADSGSFIGAAHKLHALAPVVEVADPLGALQHEPQQVKVHHYHHQQQRQQHTNDHVVTEVRVLSPVDGSVVKCPIHVQYNLVVTSFEQMQTKYAHSKACVEIDRELLVQNASRCYLLESSGYLLTDLDTGIHSLRVLIMDMNTGGGSEEEAVGSKQQQPISSYSGMIQASKEVYFTVVDETEFEEYRRQQLQRQRDKYRSPPPEHDDLAQWAVTQSSQSHDNSQSHTTVAAGVFGDLGGVNPGDPIEEGGPLPFIVIGIKTSVLHGFAQRQSIRESWASKTTLHRSVQVFFLGCRPTFSSQDDRVNQGALEAAIEMEKRVFKGDLLTQELDCDDSYYHLADKVKEFMHFATTKFPSAAYMMITDDDAYVRSHELVDLILLRDGGWPRERLYAGHVSHDKGASLIQPKRDPGHKNYLSVDQYSLQQLPPFTYGCHFVVSSDCARFIGKNRRRLRGLAGLDDVSVALWLLAMQVHPRNVVAFNHLDSAPCRENFVSFADLSPAAMRIAHANLNANKSFCRGFDLNMWRKSSTRVFRSGVKFSTTVVQTRDTRNTQVLIHITSETASVGWSFWYFPAIERFENLFPELCLNVKHHVLPSGFECAAFADGLRNHMRDVIQTEVAARRIDAAHLELWAHNLQLVGVRSPTIIAVYSTSAAFSKSMIECLLSAIYPQNPIQVIDEATYQEQRSKTQISKSPDVFVFSVLDGGLCRSAWEPQCQRAAAKYVQQYGRTSSLIVVSGESWSTDGLDERVLLVSTMSQVPQRKKHVYIPMMSMSFGERVNQSPMLLLSKEHARRSINLSSSRKFCAYMYARCDQSQREYMFDLLNAMEPVDALGVCQGSAHEPRHDRLSGRLNPLYNEDAVDVYTQYRFVIAFENAQRPGYVTEKLVNAFLAGSIPIYLGHSDTVSQLFNPKSFIDCGRFATLRACALRVMEVHRSVELYENMVREPVIGNVTRFYELFSWHPDVPSSFLASQIASLLQNGRTL